MEILFNNSSLKNDNNGYTSIPLNPLKTATAKNIVAHFLSEVENKADKNNMPDLYFHVVLIAHLMTEEIIASMGTENIQNEFKKLY